MTEYWFRKRKFGWGWNPISVEGWMITLGLVGVLYWMFEVNNNISFPSNISIVIRIVLLIIAFGYIADKKTEDKVLFK